MSDYISRAAVEEVLEKAQIISDGENCGYCTQDVNITAIPAADVAPVIHADWMMRVADDGVEIKAVCTNCKMPNKQYTPPYCPHCGAKMDAGETDD